MERDVPGIRPHGGTLVDRILRGPAREEALERARTLPRVALSPTAVSDLEMIAVGAFSPLTGFLGQADYERVVAEMHLENGLVWSMPITLAVSEEGAATLREGQEVALVEPDGHLLGLLELAGRYRYDKEREARQVFRTTETAHPGVARLYAQGDVLLAGDVWLLDRPSQVDFPEFRHDPIETRRMFDQRGWKRIVGFQTRNPVHRAHEYIQKTAMEIVDGLFLHPLVGETKGDDIPADVRMRSYQSLLRDYYPPDRVLLGVFPAAMRYAGPREAIFHALCRRNYGCTHFIVGRDHAGVGKYYGSYDAQLIFDEFDPGELGIVPLFFEHAFFCRKCGSMATPKTCPHGPEWHVSLSGTQVRQLLQEGQAPPPEMTRPEVAWVLMGQEEAPATSPLPPGPLPSPTGAGKGEKGVRKGRVLVVGMDCLEPSLLETWKDSLPHFQRLLAAGISGPLESIVPPITVPAWSCMLSGKDPGELGIYGFRNRADRGYTRMSIATARDVPADRVWDILSRAGRRVAVVGVPQTYPPSPVNGLMIGDFLSPSAQSDFTYPADLRQKLAEWVGEYILDVKDFRTTDKDWLLRQIYDMTERRFRVVRRLLRQEPWDFFMMVEMGIDRIHHGFWSQMDPHHPKHVPGNPYQHAIRDYYRYLDRELGELLELVGDDMQVLLVSDHGARNMAGGICFNDWLIREGYLVLKDKPAGIVPLEKVEVDWSRTRAWGAGGYYGRLFLNVRGREPQGTIAPEEYEAVRDEISARLAAMVDPAGRPLGTIVYKPEEVYREVRNIAPDLIVYFGDLAWRSVGSIGYDSLYTYENDTGPDDANHARHGVFALYDPRGAAGRRDDLHIMDVAPTILDRLGVPVPEGMGGKVIR